MSNADGGHTSVVWVLALEPVMFLVGKKKELLNALGVTYGLIHIEGCEAFSVIDIETAEAAINKAVKKKLVEPEQAATIMEQIRAAGVAPNLKTVFELAAQAEVPEGFAPTFYFMLHKDCSLPLPHGIIVEPDEGQTKPFTTLVDGLDYLINWVGDPDVPLNVLDGIYLMKEMIAAKMPINEADFEAQYEALPQEVRDESENSSAVIGLEMVSIPGIGDKLMISVRLPDRYGQSPQAK
jgi:hypothetical protein